MAKIISSDRCKDCKHCEKWSASYAKASCTLYTSNQGFYPDRPVPEKCIDKVERKY